MSSSTLTEGTLLWTPHLARTESSGLAQFLHWLAEHAEKRFADYDALHRWSVEDLEGFWGSFWQFCAVKSATPFKRVLADRTMPGARWFEGATLNYVDHVFAAKQPGKVAIYARAEGPADSVLERTLSWEELEAQVGAAAAWLRAAGVKKGDRVAAYLPNVSETIVAFFACASLGAIWSSCSPDMGPGAVLDRFKQIEPKVFLTGDGYRYGGKAFDRRVVAAEIVRALPTVEQVVVLPILLPDEPPSAIAANAVPWSALVARPAPLQSVAVEFDHPLWIVYSSGTTGLPKGIVHGHGGILIEQLKISLLQHDVRAGEPLMWMSSTGWIVWNLLVCTLLVGAPIHLFDGSPAWPAPGEVWRYLAANKIQHFGCGAAFITGSLKAGLQPRSLGDLSALRSVCVTGSPLTIDAYAWLYGTVKTDLLVASISGGTDIAAGFVGSAPTKPVTAGEIQCRQLGVAAHAFDETGNSMIGAVGELVITEPMPSMPLYFWNDPEGKRYRESYFDMYPGKWRHGDWIRFTERGTCVIYGRSDTTINRHGIRMGTADIYRVVEELPELADSLVVDLEYLGRPSFMPLFVVLREGISLDDALKAKIKDAIRTGASARHVPNEVYACPEIPRTLTGKKMELPVRKLLLGQSVEKVASADAMANPASFGFFVEFARRIAL
jgi:acetoacetyl-CoA synthetase